MRARRWLFSGAALLCAVVFSVPVRAQKAPLRDSLPAAGERDRRVHRGYEGWERLTPTHVKLQFAGGIGLL